MFNEDVKRIKACLYYKDYYSALQYAIIIKEKYKKEEKNFFEQIISAIKNGSFPL